MTNCSTLPSRIANRGWPKNMSLSAKSKTHEFYVQTCTEWPHCQRPVAETNWIIGSENLGRPNHVITCNNVLQHTSNTFNLNSNADGLNFFRRRALFGLLPVHAVAQESCLASQLAVGIPKMYESVLLNCTSYMSVIFCYMHTFVTSCHKNVRQHIDM